MKLDLERSFLLKSSLIGSYANMLFNFEERHSLFSRYGQITANSAAKELHITNINTKGCQPNRQTGLSLNCLFL